MVTYKINTLYYVAEVYGAGLYGECDYSEDAACATTTTPGGGLVDTGMAIGIGATLACLILFVALIIKIWRRPAKSNPSQPAD